MGIYIESLDLWITEKSVGRNSIPEEPHCIFLGAGKVVDRREQCLDLRKNAIECEIKLIDRLHLQFTKMITKIFLYLLLPQEGLPG